MKALYKKTYSHLHASEETYLEVMNMTGKHKKTRNPLRTVLIAAAITALLVTTVYAASNALIALRIEKKGGAGELSNAQVHFDSTEDVYLELGSVYPQSIPEGYSCRFVSDVAYGRQTIHYENGAGNYLTYQICLGGPGETVDILEIVKEEAVDINGIQGVLYTQKNGQIILWADEIQGFGFLIMTDDPEVNLPDMARSVAGGEPLTPTRSNSTQKALEELGDFVPGILPEGYEEETVLGCPLEEGGGWYSYVRKFYVNKTQNTRIYFEYETYAIDTESGYVDNAETACSFYIPGCDALSGNIVGQRMEIEGMFALSCGSDIAWADTERHVVFHLSSEDITPEELLEVAKSIQRADS